MIPLSSAGTHLRRAAESGYQLRSTSKRGSTLIHTKPVRPLLNRLSQPNESLLLIPQARINQRIAVRGHKPVPTRYRQTSSGLRARVTAAHTHRIYGHELQ